MSASGNRHFRSDRRALLVGAGALALAGCGGSQVEPDADGRIRLRLATDGPLQAAYGGFYQALASGAYARKGLTVEIAPAGTEPEVARRLAAGAVELGLASSSLAPLRLVAEGAPVRAVAAFFQKDPAVLMTHPEPDGPIADLTGRPMLMSAQDRAGVWPWLKARFAFTDDQLREPTGDPDPFLADDQAVRAGRLTTDPYRIEADFEPRVRLLADAGYPSYGALVLAPDAFARDNAAALRAFVAASAEGWRDYIQGEDQAAHGLIRRADPSVPQTLLDRGRQALRTNRVVDGGDAALYGLGTMTTERWQAFHDEMRQAGVLSQDLDWRRAFAVQYLPGRG